MDGFYIQLPFEALLIGFFTTFFPLLLLMCAMWLVLHFRKRSVTILLDGTAHQRTFWRFKKLSPSQAEQAVFKNLTGIPLFCISEKRLQLIVSPAESITLKNSSGIEGEQRLLYGELYTVVGRDGTRMKLEIKKIK